MRKTKEELLDLQETGQGQQGRDHYQDELEQDLREVIAWLDENECIAQRFPIEYDEMVEVRNWIEQELLQI
jgi:hypothetical protein